MQRISHLLGEPCCRSLLLLALKYVSSSQGLTGGSFARELNLAPLCITSKSHVSFLCRTNWKSKKKKKKKGKDGRLDLYALLGLQNERWTATDAQIKLGESKLLQPPSLLPVIREARTYKVMQLRSVHMASSQSAAASVSFPVTTRPS